MEDDELLKEFIDEAKDSLEDAELALLAIDKGEDFDLHYNEVFRTFHSIKGAAGMFGIEPVQKTFHHLETLLEKSKTDKHISSDLADYFLKAMDIAPRMINGETIDFPLIDPNKKKAASSEENTTEDSSNENKKDERMEELFEKKTKKSGLVYLVDDEEELLMALEDIVNDCGFSVKSFTRAKDLLEETKKKLPDVVLSDVKMPEMTGIELQKELHALEPELPVFILSGYLDKNMVIELSDNGVYGIMEKPIFDSTQLQMRLRNAAKRFRSIRLINKAINFIMYQFSDLDEMLKAKGEESLRLSLKNDLHEILKMRKEIKNLK